MSRASSTNLVARIGLIVLLFAAGYGKISPVSAQITVVGNLAHDISATPGETVSGLVVVRNESTEEQEFRAYLNDYSFQADGTNTYEAPGESSRSNAGWILFTPEAAVVPPGESVEIGYRIEIPAHLDGQADAGSYWSMLMVETVDKTSSESTLTDAPETQPRVGFRQVTRFGVQLATHVGPGVKRISLDGILLSTDDEGRPLFQADVSNTGTSMIRPDVYLRLFDEQGNEFGPFDGAAFRIYPGTSVRQQISLGEIPSGTYTALFVVDAGGEDVFGGQYSLTL